PIEELLNNDLLRSHDEEKYGKPSEEILALEKKQRETYDLVLMQATNRGIEKQNRDAHYIKAHVEAIRKAGGTPALIFTWTQKKKNAPSLDEVANAVTEIGNANHIMVIPVGLALANAEKEHPDWKLIMADKSHPTALGSYLMAAVIYASIYHRDPTEALAYRGGCEKLIPKEVREEATRIAWATIRQWFQLSSDKS
ncbi:MAG: hypothetical protein LUC43_07925, partial [Burkholderiales bacterium]|nr:hypothetical protein [Burkholderiales bacterium]